MLRVENIEISNLRGALRGMRNPLASWHLSDSYTDSDGIFVVGEKDYELTLKLALAGSDHGKFLRQIFFCADIIAPDYWWKEMDTYKVGTVANSTSTMHKITSRPLTVEDFSFDEVNQFILDTIAEINYWIKLYQETKDKVLWRRIIQNLPMSFNYTRTWTGDYENLRNIYKVRRNHKLSEWHTFCDMIETLPIADVITLPRS